MSDEQTTQDKVREIIEQARREQSRVLNLSYQLPGKVREIPEEVFDLSQLERLILRNNNIQEVPERIRDLMNLKHLDIARNPITKVPDISGLSMDWTSYLRCRQDLSKQNVEGIWIYANDYQDSILTRIKSPLLRRELILLTNLRHLGIISDNHKKNSSLNLSKGIQDLIYHIGQIQSLESLSLGGIPLEVIPDGIRDLKSLRSLGVYGANLRKIPYWLGELEHLESLNLGGNDLTYLPPSLGNLSKLKSISLYNNRFSEIPEILFQVKNLSYIHMGNIIVYKNRNQIKQIPATILQLPKLKSLNVKKQSIEIPPPEVVKEGVEAIKNYWRQQQEVGIDYLCEAKLIIVGEAGAGKTTLAKKIKDPSYKLASQEPSTEGIDVIRWSFPSAVRIKRDGREKIHNAEFKVSIWDFGGQEIYHSTHQFFLTRRSLYALVSDDRKEDTDFNYWLHVVELLSDRSPLLIVQNEKQDRQRDIDLGSLRARFPNLLREAFRTNLATNRGLIELKQMIQQELEHLPHIGTPLPKTWSVVRTALENDPRNYISLDEYFTICQENGFTRREDKRQLSGYLHDLGICLHFQDDPVLKNTVILKPKWGTDAVYSVLDDRTVLNNRGQFGPNDLARIWSDEKYSAMRDELLRLMMRFQLCYQLPNVESYIAPQLLSPTRPAYDWEKRAGLVLRYEYDFMPKGILTRFIVAANHLIADQNLVWKSGVILAREGSRAEVIEDYTRRKITIRVNGADSRGLLAIADDQLERIHASFSGLKYDKFLPCNCEVCQTRDEPFAYPLSELKDFATEGDKIQCRISRKLVDAASLIRDVFPAAAYSHNALMNQSDIFSQEICPSPEPSIVKEVFVSYAWTDESTALVDKLQEAFGERDIVLIRDKNEMQYKDSIREFMERIGRGKCIVVVLSKKYLESKNCMFELTEIAERDDIRDRVFPIVLDDARIYDALDRIGYIKHWEQKKKRLDDEMKKVGGENLQGIREELDLFARIRLTIAQIVDILSDMNALTPDQHRKSNFDSLLQALEARLSD
jgi:GTPase SAR1 family protein